MNEENYIPCACIHCGWTDGFLAELVEPHGSRIGFCDACGQEYEFKPVINLINELFATEAELDGADKVIGNLKAELVTLKAQRDRVISVLAIMVFHFGNPKRDEWLNDEGFEAAKIAVNAARQLLAGK